MEFLCHTTCQHEKLTDVKVNFNRYEYNQYQNIFLSYVLWLLFKDVFE